MSRRILLTVVLALGAAFWAVALSTAAPGPKRADLAVKSATAKLKGTTVTGSVTVVNRGTASARTSSTVLSWRKGSGSWTQRGAYATTALARSRSVVVR